MDKDIVCKRMEQFRSYMNENGLNAFIVVSSDPHSCEYVADRWKCREWISGFDGSAGTVVITADKALLWTDSRYWLAADKALAGTGIELMKDGIAETPSITEWLSENLKKGDVVGVDTTVCTVVDFDAWKAPLASCGIKTETVNDPFDQLWHDRPAVPLSMAQIMPEDVAGESASSKIARLREALKKEGVDGMVGYFPRIRRSRWTSSAGSCRFPADRREECRRPSYHRCAGRSLRGSPSNSARTSAGVCCCRTRRKPAFWHSL